MVLLSSGMTGADVVVDVADVAIVDVAIVVAFGSPVGQARSGAFQDPRTQP